MYADGITKRIFSCSEIIILGGRVFIHHLYALVYKGRSKKSKYQLNPKKKKKKPLTFNFVGQRKTIVQIAI